MAEFFLQRAGRSLNEPTGFANQNNVSIGAIGNGSVLMALDFKEHFNINYPVYTDSSCETYKWIDFVDRLDSVYRRFETVLALLAAAFVKAQHRVMRCNKEVSHYSHEW